MPHTFVCEDKSFKRFLWWIIALWNAGFSVAGITRKEPPPSPMVVNRGQGFTPDRSTVRLAIRRYSEHGNPFGRPRARRRRLCEEAWAVLKARARGVEAGRAGRGGAGLGVAVSRLARARAARPRKSRLAPRARAHRECRRDGRDEGVRVTLEP